MSEKNAQFARMAKEGDQVEVADLKKDVFSLIAWASQEGGKSLLQDNEIVSLDPITEGIQRTDF
jgi:hypothetical protein